MYKQRRTKTQSKSAFRRQSPFAAKIEETEELLFSEVQNEAKPPVPTSKLQKDQLLILMLSGLALLRIVSPNICSESFQER